MERLVRLTDAQWQRVEPLLPTASKKGGRPSKPHRPKVEAMLWILRTGAPWRDLPSAYGPWESVYTRFSRWSKAGVLRRLFEALACDGDREGFLIDASIVRAHQDASGAARKGGSRKSAPHAAVRPRRSTPSSTPSGIPSASPCRPGKRTR